MTGVDVTTAAVPLEYRYALDAAVALSGPLHAARLISGIPQLSGEIQLRASSDSTLRSAEVTVWIEPLSTDWRGELTRVARGTSAGNRLIVITSTPLARMLPESRQWQHPALGMEPLGIRRFERALAAHGFAIEERHGLHSTRALGLSLMSRVAHAAGLPEMSDRLHFTARARYRASAPVARIATVMVIVARKQERSC